MALVAGKKRIPKFSLAVGIILAVSFFLRIVGVFWGYPYTLHPDEHTIVDVALRMVQNNSFTPDVFFRPDHLLIKIDAILFYVFRFIKPQLYANLVQNNPTVFYVAARCVTVLFGVAGVFMAYVLGKKIKDEKTGIVAMLLVALSKQLVEMSMTATPDVPTLFCMLLMLYFSVCYIEKPTYLNLLLGCLSVALFSTIKYPGVLLTLGIAANVIACAIRDKKGIRILQHGLVALGAWLLMVFIISPVLFLDYGSVVNAIIGEARNEHPGADGFGFFGNLQYYVKVISKDFGLIGTVCFSVGVVWIVKNLRLRLLPLIYPVIYWVALSFLGLHWARWAAPMYAAFVLSAALGAGWIIDLLGRLKLKRYKYPAAFLGALALASMAASCITVGLLHIVPDTRIYADIFIAEEGIEQDATIYEGYTPFNKQSPEEIFIYFERLENGDFAPVEPTAQYVILSREMYGRFYSDPERFSEQVALYTYIIDNYEEIYQISGVPTGTSFYEVINIYKSLQYYHRLLTTPYTGPTIRIFRIT